MPDTLLDLLQQQGLGLPNADAADGIAVETDVDQPAGATAAQLGVLAALHDAEDQLSGSPLLMTAGIRP